MKKAILAIYDFLSGRKGLAALILAVLAILAVIPALRMHYNEDISAFLPQSEETARIREVYSMLGSENRISVLFSIREGGEPADTAYTLMNAMDSFASLALATDTPYDSLLLKNPTKKNDSIINGIMWKHIILQAFF